MKSIVEKLEFKVKYYPEDVEDELIEKSTTELFFAQVRTDISKDKIYCPADTCALLASYSLQAQFGDYAENKKLSSQIKKLMPERYFFKHLIFIV